MSSEDKNGPVDLFLARQPWGLDSRDAPFLVMVAYMYGDL